MPKEIPGYYYDAERNRYFLLKGPNTASSSSCPSSSSSSSSAANAQKAPEKLSKKRKSLERTSVRTFKLLKGRELNGNAIPLHGRKGNFFEEFQKMQASQPRVWKYSGTMNTGDADLDQMQVLTLTPEGQVAVDVLVAGGTSRFLRYFRLQQARSIALP